jgi:hypothetical protein
MFGARYDIIIERYGDAVAAQGKRCKQRGNGDSRRHVLFGTVDRKPHRHWVLDFKGAPP